MTGRTDESKLPRIYGVNWFRKDADGKFLWPGYGENSRVLEWICRRLEGEAGADGHADRRGAPARGPQPRGPRRAGRRTSPPRSRSTSTSGAASCPRCGSTSTSSASHLPPELRAELDALEQRLG